MTRGTGSEREGNKKGGDQFTMSMHLIGIRIQLSIVLQPDGQIGVAAAVHVPCNIT